MNAPLPIVPALPISAPGPWSRAEADARLPLRRAIEERHDALYPAAERLHDREAGPLTAAERLAGYRAKAECAWLSIRERWRITNGGVAGAPALWSAKRRRLPGGWREDDYYRWARKQTSFELVVIADYRRLERALMERTQAKVGQQARAAE